MFIYLNLFLFIFFNIISFTNIKEYLNINNFQSHLLSKKYFIKILLSKMKNKKNILLFKFIFPKNIIISNLKISNYFLNIQ